MRLAPDGPAGTGSVAALMRRGVRPFLLLFLALLAAGCRLDVGVDVAMQPDGSGTVTVAATADAELVAAVPSAFADLRLDDVRQAGWTVSDPGKGADGSLTLTLSKPFTTPGEANAVLAELNGPDGPLRGLTVALDRSFATVSSSLTGSVQLTGGLGAFSDAALAQALGSAPLANIVGQPVEQAVGLAVTAHFPGQVTTSTGEIAADRSSVTWRASLADGASTVLDARFEQVDHGAKSARRTSRLAWGALAAYVVALLVVILVIVVLLRRHRSTTRA
jgi:hypothetical protein